MSRYIDADALREKVLYHADTMNHAGNHEQAKAFNYCLCMIDDMPTADVVEVVRCRDCKWFNQIGCAIRIVDDSDKPTENDFCSFGERREDDKGRNTTSV